MTRELKFRAFYNSKASPSMSYNVGVHPFMIFRLSQNDLCEEGEYNDNTGDLVVCPNAYEVMQFIGLKDNIGREIYEGDILTGVRKGSNSDKVYTGCVEWQTQQCGYVIRCGKFLLEILSLAMHGDETGTHLSGFSVIGNIYENPELLTP